MVDLGEAVLAGGLIGPVLETRRGDFDGPATAATDRVVMVAARATAVGDLPVGAADAVHLTTRAPGPRHYDGAMISISRFQVTTERVDAFIADAQVAVAQFASSTGCLSAELVRNLDAPDLWAIVSSWEQVGDYRRAFNGTPAKLALIPLLSLAIDEPSAYDRPDAVGDNRPRVG